jgi:hypothetical protein
LRIVYISDQRNCVANAAHCFARIDLPFEVVGVNARPCEKLQSTGAPRAKSAMARGSRCAAGKAAPALSMSPWQAMEVGLPAGGLGPRRPPNIADITRSCELGFILMQASRRKFF